MTSIAHVSVNIQTSSRSSSVPPPWFGEVAVLISHLRKLGVLDAKSRAGALCPPPLRPLRGHRFCRGAPRVCVHLRTDVATPSTNDCSPGPVSCLILRTN
jgi:hypothetical protein